MREIAAQPAAALREQFVKINMARFPHISKGEAAIQPARRQHQPVAAERHAADIIRMRLQRRQFSAICHLPELDGVVFAAGSQQRPVRAEIKA